MAAHTGHKWSTVSSQGETPHGSPEAAPSMFMGFSEPQLHAAFMKVAEPDWRDPIWAVVDRDDVDVTVAAICYFTATNPVVKDLEFRDEFSVRADGYRLGPAGA